jgi:choline dehydrogenase-like flavoprotein
MSQDPEHGVVDQPLRIHDTAILFVASCSSFSTASSANPTFTLRPWPSTCLIT